MKQSQRYEGQPPDEYEKRGKQMGETVTTYTPPYHEYKPYGLRCQTCSAPEFASIHQKPTHQLEPDTGGEWRLSEPMVNRAIADGIRGGANITAVDVYYPEKRRHYGQIVVFESPEIAAQIVSNHNAIPQLVAALDLAARRLDFLTNWIQNAYAKEINADVRVGRQYAEDARAALALVKGRE